MSGNILLTLSVSVTLATISLLPSSAFAQFPPPPPMGGPPPISAGGPPAFAGAPPMGLGGAPRAGLGGPTPRLGAGAGPRGTVGALVGVRGGGRGPAVASSARSASVSYSRSGSYGSRYGELRYGYRGAYAAGADAAGAYTGYADGRSHYGDDSGSDCYYVSRRYKRVLVCE